MLRVNLSDGKTESFDLDSEADLERWLEFRHETDRITGLQFVTNGHTYAFPFPRKFRTVRLDACQILHRNGTGEVVGHVISVYADDIRAELLVYKGNRPRMARFSLERPGRPVHLPGLDD